MPLAPVRVSASAGAVLTTAEAKLHCRVDGDDAQQAAEIAGLCRAAEALFERATGRLLTRRVVDQSARDFGPLVCQRGPDPVYNRAEYRGAFALDDPVDYPGNPKPWPEGDGATFRFDLAPADLDATWDWPVRVSYYAGYNPGEVPAPVRTALLLLVAHWHRHREDAAAAELRGVPWGFRAVCDLYTFAPTWIG